MKVIMMTTLDDPRYRKACLNLGADHFLSKAMEFERIVDTGCRKHGALKNTVMPQLKEVPMGNIQ